MADISTFSLNAVLEGQSPERLSDVQSPAVTFASIPAVGIGGCPREAETIARARRHIHGVSDPSFLQTQRELILRLEMMTDLKNHLTTFIVSALDSGL